MSSLNHLIRFFLTVTFLACGNSFLYAGQGLSGFSVEPYLLDVTSDSAVVAFHLTMSLPAKVRLLEDDRIREFESPSKNKSHFIKITGLESGSVYDYEVICGDGEIRTPENDRSFQIRTACRSGESFIFAVYGDPRPGDNRTTRYHKKVIEQIILNEPTFCLVLGDMVDNGEKCKLWEEFFRIESRLLRRCASYCILGDNDYASGKGLFAKFFPKLERGYYKFQWGGVQFFALHAWDTRGAQGREKIDAQSPQVQWLESELSNEEVQKAPFRVVFLHDPVYISRGRSSELLRRVWAPIFRKYNVDVVFASWHLYERSHNEGVTYIISGGAGAEIIWMEKDPSYPSQAEARQHHFCRVDLGSNTMTIRAIAVDGTVLDAITLTPRSQYPDTTRRMERAVCQLRREIFINDATDCPMLTLYLFSSYDCDYCQKLIEHDLPDLAKENGITLRVFYFDFGIEGTYDLFLNAETEFGREGADVPAIFIGRSVLGGESEIEAMLPKEIAKFCKNPQDYLDQMIVPFRQSHDTSTIAEEKFKTLTYGVVAGAGFLDGVNPCAFTMIIFLISYLSFVDVSRKQIFYIGGIFTLAVFLTYFAIGLVFFNFLKLISRNQAIIRIVNSLFLLAVAVVAAFSTVDFIRCLKGNVTNMTLQLPKYLREGIWQRVRDFARNKIAMTSTSFVLGMVIAGMELNCTGLVYVPIVAMISEPRYRIAATFYLFSYNVAFIIPLVGVFLLATFGVTSEHISGFFRRHVAMIKLGFAVLFTAMTVMIIHNLRWF